MLFIDVKEVLTNDINSILETDIDNMSKEEASEFWQKHLRILDGIRVTQKEISDVREEILKDLNCKEDYNEKLAKLQSKVLRGGNNMKNLMRLITVIMAIFIIGCGENGGNTTGNSNKTLSQKELIASSKDKESKQKMKDSYQRPDEPGVIYINRNENVDEPHDFKTAFSDGGVGSVYFNEYGVFAVLFNGDDVVTYDIIEEIARDKRTNPYKLPANNFTISVKDPVLLWDVDDSTQMIVLLLTYRGTKYPFYALIDDNGLEFDVLGYNDLETSGGIPEITAAYTDGNNFVVSYEDGAKYVYTASVKNGRLLVDGEVKY